MEQLLNNLAQLLSLSQGYIKLLSIIGIGLISYFLSKALFWVITNIFRSRINLSIKLFSDKFNRASAILITLIILNIFLPHIDFQEPENFYLKKLFFGGFLFSLAFLLIKITEFLRDYIYFHKTIEERYNLNNRKIRTQIDFLQKVSTIFISLIAFAIFLMSFNKVREVGTSLIASAGIAGVIIGIAAQKSIANLLAGLQIAFTQPIRIEDTVFVENEWGKIEEISLTYVVVKIWDERRLVLPIYYFIEKPFQNWTRTSSEIIGSIFLYVDYAVSVQAVREQMQKIVQSSVLWDGRICKLQVVECTEKSMQLRGIISSSNASESFDLRCIVREELLSYISSNYPESLPMIRSTTVFSKSDAE